MIHVTVEVPRARQRTDDLIRLLDLGQGPREDSFVASTLRTPSPRIFGGQVMAQAFVACARTIPQGRLPHSLHGYFLRPGHLDKPVSVVVDRLRDGRSFSARRAQAIQDDVPILSMIASFAAPGDGPEHSDPAPPGVAAADGLATMAQKYGGVDHPTARFWAEEFPLDVRYATPDVFLAPEEGSDGRMLLWWRVPESIPDDPLLHAAIAVYASDWGVLEPVLRRHGLAWRNNGLSIASLDHAVWFHRPVRADRWNLYEAQSPYAGDARGLCQGRIIDETGQHVMSVAQEGLFRRTGAGAAND